MKSALALALLSLMLCSARAQDVQTGSIMICDTQKQVERFVALLNAAGNAQSAIKLVNTEAENPTACAVANVVYMRGESVSTARTSTDAFQIMKILVVAVNTPAGFQSVQPAAFYSIIKVKEYAV